MAPPDPVNQFCQRTGVKRSHLSNAEIKLLKSLKPTELNALANIHKKGLELRPIARVGSSGF